MVDADQAGRWAAGEQPGPAHRGLAELLAAANAPATEDELAGREAVVAAFAAEVRKAGAAEARKAGTAGSRRKAGTTGLRREVEIAAAHGAAVPQPAGRARRSRTARPVVVNVAAVLLLAGTGTAVAARGGHLPQAAQQRAHDVFSGLGVPAPVRSPQPTDAVPRASATPAPRRSATKSATTRPSASPSAAAVPAGWCRAWAAAPRPSDAPWYAELAEAAGSEEDIAAYCRALDDTGTPSASPDRSRKPPGRPSSLPTPSHRGKKK
ncbi:hypothetical protein AB0G04_32380 [Actinoplanes sp. NPDC023801]|uniref:hypothetical protein n=1 Tax=Actinoplanes sp. NPDC023801 TaxID=3154595 RepID=UPI0033E5C210